MSKVSKSNNSIPDFMSNCPQKILDMDNSYQVKKELCLRYKENSNHPLRKSKKKKNNSESLLKEEKFKKGEKARKRWAKNIKTDKLYSVEEFNIKCGNVFRLEAEIVLDTTKRRQTVIQANPVNKDDYSKLECEKIYILAKNGKVMKIGGTRSTMKERFGSYLCGHHVTERGKNQTCSLTNARIYHTIENDLLNGDCIWELYVWELPRPPPLIINILGKDTKIEAQTYHAYESRSILKFKELTGKLPVLSDNFDPKYK